MVLSQASTHSHARKTKWPVLRNVFNLDARICTDSSTPSERREKQMETQVQHRANIYKHQTEIREVENVGLVINSLKIKYFTLTHFFLYSFVFVLPWLLLLLLRSYFVWFLAKLHSQWSEWETFDVRSTKQKKYNFALYLAFRALYHKL